MYSNISQVLSALQKTDIATKIADIKLILVWLVNLTAEERQKLIKMGDKSVAFVEGVLAALKANPSIVPATFDVAEFEKDMNLFNDLKEIMMLLRPLFEGIEDTMLALSNELIRQANSGYALIKEAAKTNSTLTTTATELGARYARAGKQVPTVFTVAPNSNVTLNGIETGRLLKVLSGGPLIIYKGGSASGEGKTVGTDTTFKVPGGWNVITAVNNDATDVGIFSVIQN